MVAQYRITGNAALTAHTFCVFDPRNNTVRTCIIEEYRRPTGKLHSNQVFDHWTRKI